MTGQYHPCRAQGFSLAGLVKGGIGGIITPENFGLQNKNGFQGRVGAHLNEHLPGKLILEDVLDLLEWEQEKLNELVNGNWQLLKKENDRLQKQIGNLFENVVKGHQLLNGQIGKASLKLSGAFQVAPVSKEIFNLTDSLTRKVHSQIEKEEADIINLFKGGSTIRNAMMQSGYEEEPELFNDFVKELVNEKILVVDGS